MKNPDLQTNKTRHTRYINGVQYIFEIVFFNESGFFVLNQSLLKEIRINENIHDVFKKCKLVVLNTDHDVNCFVPIPNNDTLQKTYDLQGNGLDLISIEISPAPFDINNTDQPKIKTIFNIVDEYNIEEDGEIYKVFDLIDYRYTLLDYPLQEYSTFNDVNTNIPNLRDEDRSIPTGDAIKNLLLKRISNKDIDEKNWDKGSNNIFFTNSYNQSLLESVQYILDKHVSLENNDLCVLKTNKFEQLQLKSISNIFKHSVDSNGLFYGPEVIGNFELTKNTDGNGNFNSTNTFFVNKDFVIPVSQFDFFNQTGEDSLYRIVSHDLYNYDYNKQVFYTTKRQGDIEEVYKFIQENYLNFLPKQNKTLVKLTTINKDRYRVNKTSTSTNDIKSALYQARNDVLKNILFLSNALQFTIGGYIPSKPGKILNVVRRNTILNNFDKKLIGFWFITDVEHNFVNDQYTTTITCTKPYTFS